MHDWRMWCEILAEGRQSLTHSSWTKQVQDIYEDCKQYNPKLSYSMFMENINGCKSNDTL